ncbi:CBL-interacting serine/threonine-protein kinase 7-like [Salvia miltiorrhiza]|uniref:CBL-interacting serine/threonine-protein kinase 7-like n=1 Tax=Salvia miltiorrhiza TaxID=226208 RepID=UPI0025AB98D4|nr:CBL-interacting serine/threonine-protein kinase 7-like [Salvia miltiorrhiza]
MHRRVLEFPYWVSELAKIVIYRLLNPNPSTRLSFNELIKLSWFKKSFSQENLRSQSDNKVGSEFLDPKGFKFITRADVFYLISMSSGLNLSGLFEEEGSSKEMRFTNAMAVVEIEEKVRKAGLEFGCTVERRKGGGIRLVKGMAVAVVVEIWEVAAELWLVELRLIDGGAAKFGEEGSTQPSKNNNQFQNQISNFMIWKRRWQS